MSDLDLTAKILSRKLGQSQAVPASQGGDLTAAALAASTALSRSQHAASMGGSGLGARGALGRGHSPFPSGGEDYRHF
jgi:hypothetical protein